MKLLTFLLADYANITADGKVNIMGVFNIIYATTFPARHPMMYLVARLVPELGELDQEKTLHIELTNNEGVALLTFDGPIAIKRNEAGVRPESNVILRLDDVVFPSEGEYSFHATMAGDDLGNNTLSLTVQQSPRQA
jgi:hypothetical protein